MVHAIDMMVLPPHLSRKTQPLDVGIFRPLKRAMGSEIDRVTFLEPGQLPRGTWSELLTIAREKAFTKANISYGWRQAGLVPFNPYKVLPAAEETALAAPHKPPRLPLASLSQENHTFIGGNPSLANSCQESHPLSIELAGDGAAVPATALGFHPHG